MLIIANCKLDWGRRIDKLIYLQCISYCIKLGLCLSLNNNKFLGNLGWFFCPESYHTLSQPQRPKWALFSTPTLNTLTRNWFFLLIFQEWCNQRVITSGRKPMSSFQFPLPLSPLPPPPNNNGVWSFMANKLTMNFTWISSMFLPLTPAFLIIPWDFSPRPQI